MVMVALAPAVSRVLAVGNAQGAGWVQVCSVQGARWVLADGLAARQVDGNQEQRADHLADCAYCLLLVGPGNAPVDTAAWLPTHLSDVRAGSSRGAFLPSFPWGIALSRGPPQHS
jgi:hypothetical protein